MPVAVVTVVDMPVQSRWRKGRCLIVRFCRRMWAWPRCANFWCCWWHFSSGLLLEFVDAVGGDALPDMTALAKQVRPPSPPPMIFVLLYLVRLWLLLSLLPLSSSVGVVIVVGFARRCCCCCC